MYYKIHCLYRFYLCIKFQGYISYCYRDTILSKNEVFYQPVPSLFYINKNLLLFDIRVFLIFLMILLLLLLLLLFFKYFFLFFYFFFHFIFFVISEVLLKKFKSSKWFLWFYQHFFKVFFNKMKQNSIENLFFFLK